MEDELVFDIASNELLYDYDETTYYFKLSLLPERELVADAHTGKSTSGGSGNEAKFRQYREFKKRYAEIYNNSDNVYVIAESGVTADLNIRSVKLSSVASPRGITYGTVTTKFEIELFEPFGCSLFDKMHLLSMVTGTSNWSRAPCYFLELRFKGKSLKGSKRGEFGFCSFNQNGRINSQDNKWVWNIKFTKINVKVDQGGATYTIEAVPVNDSPKTDSFDYSVINEQISGEAKNPFELTKSLQRKMNDWVKTQRTLGAALPDHSFEIIWTTTPEFTRAITDPAYTGGRKVKGFDNTWIESAPGFQINYDPSQWSIHPAAGAGERTQGFDKEGSNHYSWDEGTSIETILEDITLVTKEMRFTVHGKLDEEITVHGGAAPSQASDEEKNRVFKFQWKVDTDMIPKHYDLYLGEYAYHFVFYLVPTGTIMPVADEKQARDWKTDLDVLKKRINKLRRRIRKKYYYIYTGRNQEVLDFNIEFNNVWFAELPRSANDIRTYDPGQFTTEQQKKILENNIRPADIIQASQRDQLNDELIKYLTAQVAINKERDYVDALTKLVDQRFENSTGIFNSRSNTIDGQTYGQYLSSTMKSLLEEHTGWWTDEKTRFNVTEAMSAILTLRSELNSDRIEPLQHAITSIDIMLQQGLDIDDNVRKNLKKIRSALDQRLNVLAHEIKTQRMEYAKQNIRIKEAGNQKYLMDITLDSEEKQKEFFEQYNKLKKDLNPVTVLTNPEETRHLQGQYASDPNAVSQRLTMAVLNQLGGIKTGDLMQISFTIRGDPYWLGYDGVTRNKLYDYYEVLQNSGLAQVADSISDIYRNHDYLLFELRFPEKYDPKTGEMKFKKDNIFRGVYQTIQVEHTFADGKFTQTISAVREHLTNIVNIKKLGLGDFLSGDSE